MKLRHLLLSLLLFASIFASAKDVIMRTDGTYIDANVEEITETTIRYRKATNPTGPIYSIPLSAVVKIVYENGTADTFNTPAEAASPASPTAPVAPTQPNTASQYSTPLSSGTPTDEELMKYADNAMPSASSAGEMSDSQLLMRYYYNTTKSSSAKLYTKAKTYSLIGWIGGVVLLTPTVIGTYLIDADGGVDSFWEYCLPIGGSVAAVGWCVGFNIWANKLRNQAREMEIYSTNLIEDEVLRFGDKSLIAGLSVMGNQMTHTQGYGLSLKFTF